MGLLPKFSVCSCSCPQPAALPGNPRPDNFRIMDVKPVGPHIVAEVQYPDATNYEGRKVILYLNTTKRQLQVARRLDPHFCDKPHVSPTPFARFAPTLQGWKAAILLAKTIKDT